jgi:carboxypeptidase Taq
MSLPPYQQLEQEFRRLHAFRGALSLLRWDAAVMMPRGSADVRGEQLAALETEHHALLTTPKVARLLERAEAGASQLEDWSLANLREMRRQRDHAISTPPSLIARLAKATARAEVYWVEAKKANDFKLFAPHLEEVVHLVRDRTASLGQSRGLAPYDALVDVFTPGISTADIDTIFKAPARKLPGLINEAIEVQAQLLPLPVTGKFTVARQRQLSIDVLKALGSPFDRGRLDESEHPFTEGVPCDIRVTTRFDVSDPFTGLGAYHDGYIEFVYPNANCYRLSMEHLGQGHGDWRYDESRLGGYGRVIHEIEWATFGATGRWIIEASDVHHKWTPKSPMI